MKRVQNIRPLYQYLDNKIKENAFHYSQANFKIVHSLFHSRKMKVSSEFRRRSSGRRTPLYLVITPTRDPRVLFIEYFEIVKDPIKESRE